MGRDLCDMACDKPKVRHLKERSGWYHYERRVPRKFQEIDSRPTVRRSLQTDSYREACRRVVEVDREVEAQWEAALKAFSAAPEQRRDGAAALAKECGFEYRSAAALAESAELDAILKRIEFLEQKDLAGSKPHRLALLGGAGESSLKLSELVNFYVDYQSAEHARKSEEQMRRFVNPRHLVVREMMSEVGDKEIRAITRDDMLAYRAHLAARQQSGEISAETANKQLKYLRAMLKLAAEAKQLLTPPVEGLTFKSKGRTQRQPIPVAVIQDRLLASGALARLNEQARRAVFVMVETGMRPSEIVNIAADNIRLDAELPHVIVAPTATRELKTETSEREIPLVGVSLMAFQAQPEGFPRYRDREAAFSALVNKTLRTSGIVTEKAMSLYSLRHSFEDRMIEAGADERMRCELMGHRYEREKYGRGSSLELKHALLRGMALTPPGAV